MAEEAEPDTASWVEVKVTSYFTAVTTAAFLIVFEVARRSPYLSQVFDRRRSTSFAKGKCPPPLSRRSILEWLFISTDPQYLEYSEMVHMKLVVQERKRQQVAAGTRDFDELKPPSPSPSNLDAIQEEDDDDEDDDDEEGDDEEVDPEDDEEEEGDLEEGRPGLTKSKTGFTTKSSGSGPLNASTIRKKPHRNNAGRVSHALTPDVVIIDGRRLPANVADYALSGDLTLSQIERYEQKLIEKENREEHEFRKRQQAQNSHWCFWKLQFLGTKSRVVAPWRAFLCWKKGSKVPETPTSDDGLDLAKSARTMTTTSSGSPPSPNSRMSRVSSGRSILSNFLGNSPTTGLVNRHLKSTSVKNKRPLESSDRELLRCVGLDAFVMIRFLRLGFDCTFYPFLVACLTLVPTYMTNDYKGDATDGVSDEGYFLFTINTLEPKSPRLWIPWAFSIVYFCYVLRKVWIEWETFMVLRFDFLVNGDLKTPEIEHNKQLQKEDVRLQLEQYRNSCMVEYVPESHQRDKELFEFFDAVFPNQVKRAEVLLNAKTLTQLAKEREQFIVNYENTTAEHYHAKQVYRRQIEEAKDGGCCRGKPEPPEEPMVPIGRKSMVFCGNRKMVRALPYYLSEIKRLNGEIEEEHRRIMEEKHKSEDKELSQNIFSIGLRQGLKYVVGASTEFTCATGFVEFTNLTAKQSAIQCNISGTTDFMLTTPAPDPHDIVWKNATVDIDTIRMKRVQCDALLFTAALFWSVVVTFITSISNMDKLEDILPDAVIPKEDSFWYGLIQGYVPVLFLEFFMLFVPIVLRIVAKQFIRFKTRSEVDQFVFFWHFVFRVCNLLIIMISGSIFSMLKDFQSNPSDAVTQLASNIAQSSQFFLNNMIFAAGTETSWELAQVPTMVLHFVTYRIVTVEAKSKRSLERLDKAERFEWGHVIPPFIFGFLVAAVYCAMVPVLLGACAIFFYVSYKVYMHQALYVYAQPYEGGGKLMYMINRTIFIIIYIAIIIFSTVLGLRQAPAQAPSFFFIMSAITVWVDVKISKKFVRPSLTLALTNARIIDDENKMMEDRARQYKEYKAAKLQKQKNKRTPRKSKELQAPEDEEAKTPERRKIQFSDSEESPKGQSSHDGPNSSMDSSQTDASSEANDIKSGSNWEASKKYDFYLYRQPILNKTLWETKPRPYR